MTQTEQATARDAILAERSPMERALNWVLRRWWAVAVLVWGGVISNQFGSIATDAFGQIVQGKTPTFTQVQNSWAASEFKSQPILGAVLLVAALAITGLAWIAERAERARLTRLAERAEVERQKAQRAEIRADTKQMLQDFFQEHVVRHDGEETEEDDGGGLAAAPAVVLPPRPTLIVGRESELDAIRAKLEQRDTSAVALKGLGGVGKSTLLAEALYRLNDAKLFPDGVIWLACNDLGGDDGAARLYDAVTIALGLGDGTASQSLMAKGMALRRALAGRRILFALDNVEAELPLDTIVQTLTARGANNQGPEVLLTTRVNWPDIPGLAEIDLDALSSDQGFILLKTLIERGGQPLAPADEPAVRAIVDAIGALPLAIELVAPRITRRTEPLPALAQRLLAEGVQLKGRTRSIERTFDVTYSQLDEEQATAFCALAVFAGADFSQEAALVAIEASLPGRASAQLLTDLSDLSLLRAINQTGGTPRYALHPLLRQFARERLTARATREINSDSITLAVTHYYQQFVHDHTRKFRDDIGVLEAEFGNLIGVLTWLHTKMDVPGDLGTEATKLLSTMSVGLRRFFIDRGYWTDGRMVMSWGVEASGRLGERLRETTLLGALGFLARMQGDLDLAERYNIRALELARGRNDRRAEAARIASLGTLARMRGDFALARARYEESLDLRRKQRDTSGMAATLRLLGALASEQGNWDEARAYLRESLESKDTPGSSRSRTYVELASVNIRDPQGDREQARKLLDIALGTARQYQQRGDEATSLDWLGALALEEGNLVDARQRWEEALALYTKLGSALAPQTRERLARIDRALPVAVGATK